MENEYTYDKRGRITHSTTIGAYHYNDDYRIQKLGLNAKGQQLKQDRGFPVIICNGYKKAVKIHLENKERIDFEYNIFRDRTVMYYGSEDKGKTARPLRKYYSSDKAVAIKHNTKTNTIEGYTYMDGDPYTANIVQKNIFTEGKHTKKEAYYLHRDYQSSILAVSDQDGSLLEKRYFDAWGNIKQLWNKNNENATTLLYLDRGYTGHEHLQGTGHIHMNGRLYDPELRRFLAPDNFVPNPYDTQCFNRYGYVLNNPLVYTDPDGELPFLPLLAIGIGAAVTSNAIVNIMNGIPWWYGMAKAVVVGAVTTIVSLGLGGTISASVEQYLGDVAIGILSNMLPALDIKIGDFTISLNAVVLSGQGRGIGAAVSVRYHSGNFDFYYGFGVTYFGKHYGTGKKGWQFRNSFMVGWDDGNKGLVLGTNIWGGTTEIKKTGQRTGIVRLRSGGFSFSYENDGTPFGHWPGDGGDSYRTAALRIGIGDFRVCL